VYSFTLAGGSDVFLTTVGSSIDTVLYMRSGSCTGTEVGCRDDYATGVTGGVLSLDNLGAGTYYVFVDGKTAGALGTFRLEVNINGNDGSGDRCGQPYEWTAGSTQLCGRTDAASGAGGEYTGTCGGNDRDRVYYVVLPATTTAGFRTCNAGTNYNTVLYLRRACTDTATEVACNNDDATCGATSRSLLPATSLSAGIYYLFVDGNGASGNYCVDRL
jgi:hypothetical protein